MVNAYLLRITAAAGTYICKDFFLNKSLFLLFYLYFYILKTVSNLRSLHNIPHCDLFLSMILIIVVDQSFNSTNYLWLGKAFISPTTIIIIRLNF